MVIYGILFGGIHPYAPFGCSSTHEERPVFYRGYYPKGGGEVTITAYPVKCLSPLTLTDPGKIIKVVGRAFVAGVLPIKVIKCTLFIKKLCLT